MRKLILAVLAVSGLLSSVSVLADFGSSDKWNSGFTQGVHEYVVVSQDGTTVYNLSCDGSEPTELFFGAKDAKTGVTLDGPVAVTVNGQQHSEPFKVASYSSAAEYHRFWESLRLAKTVSFGVGGVVKPVTVVGLQSTLPKYTNGFDCALGF